MPKAVVHDIRKTSTDDSYHGWSTIARLDTGELLTVCSGGRERHVCPYGKVQLFRSSDDGQTWSQPEVLVDGPIDDRDAGIIQTPKGTIIVTWFTSQAWAVRLHHIEIGVQESHLEADEIQRWRDKRQQLAESIHPREELGVFLIRSTDGGKTWGPRQDAVVSSPHGPTVTRAGRLLHVGKPKGDYTSWLGGAAIGGTPITVVTSDDEGQTWQTLGEIPPAEGHSDATYHEPHIIEADDGRLIVHIRNHAEPWRRDTLQSESTDGGITWSTPRPLGVNGFPPHLLKLRDARLVMSYGYRNKPYGNRAVVSEDHGQTWSEPMTISDDGLNGDLGYPSTVELGNGELLTVWYEKQTDSPNAILRQARWSIEA